MTEQMPNAFLIIEKGHPYQNGEILSIDQDLSIGRTHADQKADISFSSNLITRQEHIQITQTGEQYFIRDAHSKHGSWLNGELLVQGRLYELSNGDRICLAGETVVCYFYTELPDGATANYPIKSAGADIVLLEERREIHVAGQRVELSGHLSPATKL
jgi:pSer/pThr/pTyr-binding forkhead associated (FHA) protein